MYISLNPNYRMLICTITIIIIVNINMTSHVPRRHSRASMWQSHVALSATSHPRGLARKIPFFAFILINLIK